MSVKVQIVSWSIKPALSIDLESGLPQEPVLYIPASMAGDIEEINRLIIRSDSAYKRMKESMRGSRYFAEWGGPTT